MLKHGFFCWLGGTSSAVCGIVKLESSCTLMYTISQQGYSPSYKTAHSCLRHPNTQIMGSCSESWLTSSSSMLVRRLQWPKPLIFCLFASGASVILPQELSRIWNMRQLRDSFREQRRLWQPAAGVVWVLASTSRQSGKPTSRQPTRNRCS